MVNRAYLSEDRTAKQMGELARTAAQKCAIFDTDTKNQALERMRAGLITNKEKILSENKKDVERAMVNAAMGGLDRSLIARLQLKDFDSLIKSIDSVLDLKDPAGQCDLASKVSEDTTLYRISTPIGVLGVIFESRPEACVQIASLAIKSGNVVMLKGGKEASYTNKILVETMSEALEEEENWPSHTIQFVDSREKTQDMLKCTKTIDLIIPRGSAQLVEFVKKNTLIPVLGHADGLCSLYVDESADLQKAVDIIYEAKTDYPAVCNAVETLLIHENVLQNTAEALGEAMHRHKRVEFRCCPESMQYFEQFCVKADGDKVCKPSSEEDYKTEFLDLILAVKVVKDMDDAITHINGYGSHHTDGIIAENMDTVELFMQAVDSSSVVCNASTRFADGYRYGFGAEVGISTNRIHSRGPVGLEGLVIYKYRLYGPTGEGERASLVGDMGTEEGKKPWLHEKIKGVTNLQGVHKRQGPYTR